MEHWSGSGRSVDLFDIKAVAERICQALGADVKTRPLQQPWLVPSRGAAVMANDTRVGIIGQLAAALADGHGLPGGDPVYEAAIAGSRHSGLEHWLPLFYDRADDGLPHRWLARVLASLRQVVPFFNTHRMVRDYAERGYVPAAAASAREGETVVFSWIVFTSKAERDRINRLLQEIIDRQTDPWGIKVSAVEVKHVDLPETMKRAMARQAESERERRAKIVNAEGAKQAVILAAEGQAEARLRVAQAEAQAIEMVTRSLGPTASPAQYLIAKSYLESLAQIAEDVGARFAADIAHIAGLVATGLHPDPVPYADAVTMTTHKLLRGPRGAIILAKAEHAKAIDRAVFPGLQGGPHDHVTAATAVCLHEASTPEYVEYCKEVIANAQTLADELEEAREEARED